MCKCKIFSSKYVTILEEMVNNWFAEMDYSKMSTVDIQFRSSGEYLSVMITYYDIEAIPND